MLFYFVLFTTLNVLVGTALIFLFYARLPRPEAVLAASDTKPMVSVIVPARNEEANIERCLISFATQDYPNLEIVVIDDRSTDGTGAIIERLARQYPNIRALQSNSLPPEGWTGKNNALVQAVDQAKGDWFYFADADTCHFPNSIAKAICYATEKKAHLVSFWPLHEFGSLGERLITPALWSTFFWIDPLQWVNDYGYDIAYAVGHAILVERKAYLKVGGHQSIHEWIIEDHALAKIMKNRGFHIQMADGSTLCKVRMYASFDAFWHGWSKMLFAIIEYKPRWLMQILSSVICTMVLPFVQLAIIIPMWMAHGLTPELQTVLPLIALQFLGLLAWERRIATHFERLGWLYYLLLPFSGLILCACYVHSAFLVLSGAEVNWKGRKYSVSRLKLPGTN